MARFQRWDEAHADRDRALTVARDVGGEILPGALTDRAHLLVAQGRFTEALPYLDEALPLSRGMGNGRPQAIVECNLSRAHTGLGHYQQALRHAENELVLFRQAGALDEEALALHHAARAWQGLGEHHRTIELCREAIALGRELATALNYIVAEPLDTLAVSLHHTGDTTSAIICWDEAAKILDDYGLLFQADQVRDRAHRASKQT